MNAKIVHFQFAFLEILYPRSWVLKKQTANLQANLSITLWLTAYTAWKSVAHSIEELKKKYANWTRLTGTLYQFMIIWIMCSLRAYFKDVEQIMKILKSTHFDHIQKLCSSFCVTKPHLYFCLMLTCLFHVFHVKKKSWIAWSTAAHFTNVDIWQHINQNLYKHHCPCWICVYTHITSSLFQIWEWYPL